MGDELVEELLGCEVAGGRARAVMPAGSMRIMRWFAVLLVSASARFSSMKSLPQPQQQGTSA
jgi:hypothetical protein